MIEVQNLTKYYGTKQALDNISFSIREGEVLGFLGPNGAGKSTAMKIITCYLSPSDGTVTVDGFDVFNDSLAVRKLIGYLPEHPPLYLDMTVKDYIEFTAKIKGVTKKNLRGSVDRVVEKCGLQKYYHANCGSLSKGYRQRVGIAQAMVHEPKFLILDEPTIGLDPIQIVEIRELIKGFGKDHTVILSTHILPEVDMTCERVIIINDGKVVAEDTMKNLRGSIPQTDNMLVEYQGSSNTVMKTIEGIDGVKGLEQFSLNENRTALKIFVEKGADPRPEIARTIISENLDLLEIKFESMTLEQIFVNITMN